MPLPDSIPVKFPARASILEDAPEILKISIKHLRPLVRQTFRPAELIDMIVSVTGKDSERVTQILRSGTIVFNSYRYWWHTLDPESAALSGILAKYPDAQPSRAFHAEDCTEVILESPGTLPRHSLRLRREEAARNASSALAASGTRSWIWHANTLPPIENIPTPIAPTSTRSLRRPAIIRLTQDAARHAPRALRAKLAILPKIAQAIFICPRR